MAVLVGEDADPPVADPPFEATPLDEPPFDETPDAEPPLDDDPPEEASPLDPPPEPWPGDVEPAPPVDDALLNMLANLGSENEASCKYLFHWLFFSPKKTPIITAMIAIAASTRKSASRFHPPFLLKNPLFLNFLN